MKAHLDRYDIAAAVAAGLTASIVDGLLVAIPKNLRSGDTAQRGSALTAALRDLAVDDNNWLAKIARVPYDQIAGTDIEGIGPRTHRVQTFGHDPLLGLVLGTMDILKGTLTGVSKEGEVATINALRSGSPDIGTALATQVLHLLSDAPTRMGLPLPGWFASAHASWSRFTARQTGCARIIRQSRRLGSASALSCGGARC